MSVPSEEPARAFSPWPDSCRAAFIVAPAKGIVAFPTKEELWISTYSIPTAAAIVYDDGASVDGLMSRFASELIEAGVDARGIVQLPPDAEGCGPGALMKLRDVATGEIIPLCQDLGPGAGGCCLDASALAGAAVRLRAAASTPSDILFFSKFAKQEAAGGGARAELAYAVSEGRTVLTAVKRALLPKWHAFTGGQGTLLEHRLWVDRNWWQDISSLPRGPLDRAGAGEPARLYGREPRMGAAAEARALTRFGWTIATRVGRSPRGCRRSSFRFPS